MSAPTSHMTASEPPQSHGRAVLPRKAVFFHLAKFKTLFTLSPQENFPVDSRRIYELIKPSLKKRVFSNLVALGAGAVLLNTCRSAHVRGRHLGRTRWSRHLCAPVEAVSTPPSARHVCGQPAVTCQRPPLSL